MTDPAKIFDEAVNESLWLHRHVPTEQDIHDVSNGIPTDVMDTAHAQAAIRAAAEEYAEARVREALQDVYDEWYAGRLTVPCPCKGCYADKPCELKPHLLPVRSESNKNESDLPQGGKRNLRQTSRRDVRPHHVCDDIQDCLEHRLAAYTKGGE